MIASHGRRGGVNVLFLAVLFMLASAGIGALVAVYSRNPVYCSEALVSVPAVRPTLMGPGTPVPEYEKYASSLALLAHSRRVADLAAQDPLWKAAGRESITPEELLAGLSVRRPPGSEFITLSFCWGDGGTAAAAVTAATNAFVEVCTTTEMVGERQRMGILDESELAIQARIDALQSRIRQESTEFGTADLAPLYQAAVARLQKVTAALTDVRIAAAIGGGSLDVKAGAAATAPPTQPTTQPAAPGTGVTPPREQETALARLLEDAKREVTELGSRSEQWDRQKEELRTLRERSAELDRRKEQLRAEQNLGSRLTVVSTGEVPQAPQSRWLPRRVACGAGIGAGAALLLILLVGSLSGRRS